MRRLPTASVRESRRDFVCLTILPRAAAKKKCVFELEISLLVLIDAAR